MTKRQLVGQRQRQSPISVDALPSEDDIATGDNVASSDPSITRNKSDTTKLRRSLRDTNRMSLPSSAHQRKRLSDLFFDESEDDDKERSADQSSALVLQNLVLQQLHRSPNIYVIDDFLNAAELAYFDEQTKRGKGFKRSYVDDSSQQSTYYDKEHRTSTFMSFQKRQNTRITAIERRSCELLGLWNTEAVEPLQLVRYNKGEFFGKHHDLGDLDEETGKVSLPPRNMFSKRRLATIFCYLNDVPDGAGGETLFPHVSGSRGLSVGPKKGRAVLFCNVKKSQDGNCLLPDERTVHEGRPVARGKKYGLNIWICES